MTWSRDCGRLVGVWEEAVAGWEEDGSGRKRRDVGRGQSESIRVGQGSVQRC